ncbi:MAG: YigZ family protein [Firmicutes bacterium]|nr:YigZ family protein [Bacillota bacterium]
MKLYSTVYKEGTAEQIIEKSRFIAYVRPVENRQQADDFIAAIKKKHKDATHNVPAMVIGDKFQIQWASDDGEPQGTSGAPIVQMLVKEGITNVAVVVTRYFGGIKLGTGGLVRAYTSSAKLGLAAAELCDVEARTVLSYEAEYTHLTKIQNLAGEGAFQIEDLTYTDLVTLKISCQPEEGEAVLSMLSNLTAGRGRLKAQEVCKVKCPK